MLMKTEYDRSRDARRSFGMQVHHITLLQQDAGATPWLRRDKGRAGLACRLATRRTVMFKSLIASFFMLVSVAPALATPIFVYPVSCGDLWPAVHDTLDNQDNYGVLSMDESRLKAYFIVVGARGNYTQKVELKARNGGCEADADIIELGPDNADWRQFQHRLRKSLAKLQAAKPKSEVTATGQQ
jgi:hypothetical protein